MQDFRSTTAHLPTVDEDHASFIPPEKLMTRAEVHSYFGLTQRYLEVSAVRGDGPPMVKIGRAVRYRVADVRAWIEARRVASTSQGVAAK